MSFADLLAEEKEATRKGPLCGMGLALAALDEVDREQVRAALADPKDVTQHAQISRALKRLGVPVQPTTVSRHRAGECGCQ